MNPITQMRSKTCHIGGLRNRISRGVVLLATEYSFVRPSPRNDENQNQSCPVMLFMPLPQPVVFKYATGVREESVLLLLPGFLFGPSGNPERTRSELF
jgi:hypothetical protein